MYKNLQKAMDRKRVAIIKSSELIQELAAELRSRESLRHKESKAYSDHPSRSQLSNPATMSNLEEDKAEVQKKSSETREEELEDVADERADVGSHMTRHHWSMRFNNRLRRLCYRI